MRVEITIVNEKITVLYLAWGGGGGDKLFIHDMLL